MASAAWNACAVPWKLPRMVDGSPIRRVAASIVVTALPSETPGARLNEIVTDGNWLW